MSICWVTALIITGKNLKRLSRIFLCRKWRCNGGLIAQIVLLKENARQYPALLPYLPGGEKSDMSYDWLYWDYFSEGKVAYVPIHYQTLADAAA